MQQQHVLSGIDNIHSIDRLLQNKRIGIMTNPTGINKQGKSTVDVLNELYHVTALYAVEHGIRGDIQAGEKVDTYIDEETHLPVFSAYGKNKHFNEEMLDAFDVLVFDIQDVGARFYTYLYSLAYAMQACAQKGKSVVVLDRINPLGLDKLSGTVLQSAFSSFVGDYALPTQYALTIGEFALYVKDLLSLDIDLHVVKLEGINRHTTLVDTDLLWVSPSPNCPTYHSILCYIGTCLFEGTCISEGRGTTLPFEVVGAPFINGEILQKEMNALHLEGVFFRPVSFTPTFSKFQNQNCKGVQMHVTNKQTYNAFYAGLMLLDTIKRMYPADFSFISTRDDRYFIDLLMGTNEYRLGNISPSALVQREQEKLQLFKQKTQKYHLYEGA